jgi:hypothetical protein
MKCWILKRVVVAVAFFAAVQATGLAQGVLSHSADVALNGGASSVSGIDGNPHPFVGISGSYNVWRSVSAFVEYSFTSGGSLGSAAGSAATAFTQRGGGGARYYFAPHGHLVPYATVAGGYLRSTVDATGTGDNTSVAGGYFGFGLGANLYGGENWGIRPELRYQREFYGTSISGNKLSPQIGLSQAQAGSTANSNVVEGTVSFFFQFGGEASSKK